MPTTQEFTRAEFPVTFASRALSLRVVMEPGHPIRNSWGDKIGDTLGHTIEFQDGRFVAETDEEIAYLRSRMNDPSGPDLVELGTTSAPDSKPVLQTLALASRDEIQQILNEERGTWRRQDVMDLATALLEQRHGETVEPEPTPDPVAQTVQAPADPEPVNIATVSYQDVPWPQLKQFASSQGINTHGKKREEIEAELATLQGKAE